MIQITLSENQDRNKKSMTKSSLILLMPRIVVSTVSIAAGLKASSPKVG